MADPKHLPERKHIHLSIDQPEDMVPAVKALASLQRLQILKMLGVRSMYVNEVAEQLDLPVSTAAHNICVLEEAGLITCEQQPGLRGTMKLCHRRLDSVTLSLAPQEERRDAVLSMSLPVGCYSVAEDIAPTCGLAGLHASIGEDDNPRSFYSPDRFNAQLLWFRHGYITYHFAILRILDIDVQWLELSF
ncbi:MAG TPA: helix-turn-helix domain-containing protein, partial [Clostridia bacterium]|nr:helix-turn-helix domain-containing protein [Clostridia bacterium]